MLVSIKKKDSLVDSQLKLTWPAGLTEKDLQKSVSRTTRFLNTQGEELRLLTKLFLIIEEQQLLIL